LPRFCIKNDSLFIENQVMDYASCPPGFFQLLQNMRTLLLVLFGFCCCFPDTHLSAQPDSAAAPIIAEFMPYFPGCADLPQGSQQKRDCSNENLVAFISDYLEYPEAAKKQGVEGTVYVRFAIDTDGKVYAARIARDIGAGCGLEALRIVQNMPRWEPALQAGEPVMVELTLPVKFSIKDDNAETGATYTLHWGDLRGDKVTKHDLINSLKKPFLVRDEMGNALDINEIAFAYRRNKKQREATGRGAMTYEMEKIVRRVKPGGSFVMLATVQKGPRFVVVERAFEIVK
jgi:TonB family protein